VAIAKKKRRKMVRFRDRAKCRFCRENVTHIDYKDTQTLQKLITTRGKMLSRKRSGNCAKHQRAATRALKRARFLSLMPYVS
jgi:small subunit ribosomal protein S18